MTTPVCNDCGEMMWKIGTIGRKNNRRIQRYYCSKCGTTCQAEIMVPDYVEEGE